MKIIQPSHELWYPSEPLKDIERAARISYASEGKTTETSAKPLVDKLFKRGHMTPFEFVTFTFHCSAMYGSKLIYMNQLPNIQSDLICIHPNIGDIDYYGSCNLRSAIKLSQTCPQLAGAIVEIYPELEQYFSNIIPNVEIKLVNYKGSDTTYFEFEYQTVKFVTNRGVTHELVRHRKAGFVQSSTRYIGYDGEQFNGQLPIVMNQGFVNTNDAIIDEYKYFIESSQYEYNHYRELGMSPGEARAILPNDTMSEIVMIARHWSWKHFFGLRIVSGAHPDMRALVIPCYEEFKSKWPEYYVD